MNGAARDTPVDENRRLVRRYFEEVLNAGRLELADTLLAPDVVFQNPPVIARGPKEFKDAIAAVRAAFPDLRFAIEDEIAAADKIVTRWRVTGTQTGTFFGRAASGRRIDVSGMNIFRIADGVIREIWVNMDRLGELIQLGWVDAGAI